jgi:hypothetical protein
MPRTSKRDSTHRPAPKKEQKPYPHHLRSISRALPAENAERELKVAYNSLMEMGTVWTWSRTLIPLARTLPLAPEWAYRLYRTASALYRNQERPASEHWARACQHYSTALWHEAKLAWLDDPECPKDLEELPHSESEFHLHESPNLTRDLLDDLTSRPKLSPPALGSPGGYAYEWLEAILSRARVHLQGLPGAPEGTRGLKECESIKAAEEWARCAEELMAALSSQAKPVEGAESPLMSLGA